VAGHIATHAVAEDVGALYRMLLYVVEHVLGEALDAERVGAWRGRAMPFEVQAVQVEVRAQEGQEWRELVAGPNRSVQQE
jgi:hypothetical protein